MQEKLICCCGASGWTRVIGWFQVIGYSIYTVGLIIGISVSAFTLENTDGGSVRHADGSLFIVSSGDKTGDLGLGTASPGRHWTFLYCAIPVVSILLLILAFAMSIVLLRGSYSKNTRYLGAWLIYTGICLTVSTLTTIVGSIVFSFGVEDGAAIAILILIVGFVNFLIQGFCMWIVYTHKKEIAGATGMTFSALSEAKL